MTDVPKKKFVATKPDTELNETDLINVTKSMEKDEVGEYDVVHNENIKEVANDLAEHIESETSEPEGEIADPSETGDETVEESEDKAGTDKSLNSDEIEDIGGALSEIEGLSKEDETSIKESYTDMSSMITILTGDPEDAKEMLAKIIKREANKTGLSEESKEYISDLYRTMKNTYDRDMQGRLLSAMLAAQDTELSSDMKGLKDGVSRKTKVSKDKRVTGRAARLAVMSRLRGLKRIHLLNSGFYIDLRPPTLLELSEFYNSVDETSKEYGRILGGHFYIIQDIYIKEKLLELFPTFVENSNLENWDEGDTLLNALSFLDYDTCIWGLITLMYSKGIQLNLQCSNEECDFFTTNVTVDLNNLRLNLMDKIPSKALKFLMNNKNKTTEEVKEYQRDMLDCKGHVLDDLNGVDLKYNFKVPTVNDYLDFGLSLISDLSDSVVGDFTIENVEARNSFTYSSYQMFQPWIDSIEFYDENGELDILVDDPIGISDTLQLAQQDSLKLRTSLLEYMSKCKLTYICYTSMKCPKCGRVPYKSVSDYLPVDPQQVFFFLTCQHLLLAELH